VLEKTKDLLRSGGRGSDEEVIRELLEVMTSMTNELRGREDLRQELLR
jgi:predicted site-specific integrase-resolvase